MSQQTVVLRLVGAATLVGQPQQQGAGTVMACAGGYGPMLTTASQAATLLLQNRPVRIPTAWERSVRHVLAKRARAGRGTDGSGANWQNEPEATTR